MKKLHIFLALAFGALLLTSCYKEDPLELDRHSIEVGYEAQDITVNAKTRISRIGFWYADSDSGKGKEYKEGDKFYCEGDWFRLILDYSEPTYLTVSMDENDSGMDRTVKVDVGGAHKVGYRSYRPKGQAVLVKRYSCLHRCRRGCCKL